ncbi:MAG TPA: hypothetical protein PK405_08105 [Hyphomicrobiales bacterium]|nr:hypothetical protein [Hyphomicrobiales bacterium]
MDLLHPIASARPVLLAAAAIAFAAAPAFTPKAAEAAVCLERKALISYLSERFSEKPRALGLVESANVMEVYVSGKGTWTIVVSDPRGLSCIVAAGDTWEDIQLAMGDGPEL